MLDAFADFRVCDLLPGFIIHGQVAGISLLCVTVQEYTKQVLCLGISFIILSTSFRVFGETYPGKGQDYRCREQTGKRLTTEPRTKWMSNASNKFTPDDYGRFQDTPNHLSRSGIVSRSLLAFSSANMLPIHPNALLSPRPYFLAITNGIFPCGCG